MTDDLEPSLESLAPSYWVWTTQAPPLSGQLCTDNAAWLGATLLSIDRRTDSGVDVSTDLAAIKAADLLRVEMATDATRYAAFLVNAPATRVVDVYQFPVTYSLGGGRVPVSGVRLLVTFVSGANTTTYWTIESAREPSRFWIRCECPHGLLTELVATNGGSPSPSTVIPSTAYNLRRKTGCNCATMSPALNPAVP